MLLNQNIFPDIKDIIANAKDKAIRLVDNQRTLIYWKVNFRGKTIGKR